MSYGKPSRGVRLALEQLENRLTPTAVVTPPDLIDTPPEVDLPPEPPAEYQPPEDGGFFSNIEDSFFGAVTGNGGENGYLRIGNRYKTVPSVEVATLLKLPAGQEVWLVNEQSPIFEPGEDWSDGSDGGHGVPLPPPIEDVVSVSRAIAAPAPGEDWLGDLFPEDGNWWENGEIPIADLVGELPPEWAENPEFVLPNLPEIVDLVPEGWDSLKGLEGLLDNIQFTLQLDSYRFHSGDGTGDASATIWGDMFLFSEPDSVWFNTRDGISPDQDAVTLDLRRLESMSNINWLFTEAGTYEVGLSVRVTATLGDESKSFDQKMNLKILVGGPKEEPLLVVGVGGMAEARVALVDPTTQEVARTFLAYENYKGGVVTAVGDVNGDGQDDYITAPGGLAPSHITVRDGATGDVMASLYAFPGFIGTYELAAGDSDGDGFDDVYVGVAKDGPPHLVMLSGAALARGAIEVMESMYVYDQGFRGGIRLTTGDLDGNGIAEVVVGSGVGATPHIVTCGYDAETGGLAIRSSYLAYAEGFRGGVYLSSGDVDGDGDDDVVTGSGAGAEPTVVVFDGLNAEVLKAWYPYQYYPQNPAVTRQGIQVAVVPDAEGKPSVVISPVGGHAASGTSPEDYRDYLESEHPELVDDSVWSDPQSHWFKGTGLVQVNLESEQIEHEYDVFAGYRGRVNIR